jgi:hypothetical protein
MLARGLKYSLASGADLRICQLRAGLHQTSRHVRALNITKRISLRVRQADDVDVEDSNFRTTRYRLAEAPPGCICVTLKPLRQHQHHQFSSHTTPRMQKAQRRFSISGLDDIIALCVTHALCVVASVYTKVPITTKNLTIA